MYKWFVWNIFFRLHEAAKRHETFRILREMETADCFTSAQLEEYQQKRLRELIDYAYAHVPYVRQRMQHAGIAPQEIRDASDLAHLPLMTKADVRENRLGLRSDIAQRLTSFTTGGSTGEPLIFDLARRRVASRVACRQRTSRWWGVSVGDPELAIWGSPVELKRQDRIRAIRDVFLATRLLSAFEMNESAMSRYLDILEKGGYRQIFGYPSALYLLCLHARQERRNLRGLRLKVAFVTGEVLFPYQRDLISEVLNCPVANGYGGRDSALIASECPHGRLHVLIDAMIIELIDAGGRSVARGQPGEIVITDLYSHEVPFIRYATGDIGVLSPHPCPCGRPLPVLERIEGRANDSVVAPDGRIINSLALIYGLRETDGIVQFLVRQQTIDRFHVKIVRNRDFPENAEDRIRAAWTALLRSPLKITFEYLPKLPPESSGKFRHVVSDLNRNGLPRLTESSGSTPDLSKIPE